MPSNLNKLLSKLSKQKYATDTGTEMHKKMQKIIIDNTSEYGDSTLIKQIKLKPELLQFFTKSALAEIPIAGKINGKFISRRIDRMIKNDTEKSIVFLDYKTDINKELFHDKYILQMNEHKELLKNLYPNYFIHGLILWLNDFSIEEIC